MTKKYAATLVFAAALAGCNGWPKAPELSEARTKPEKFPTYSNVSTDSKTFAFDNRTWMVQPVLVELHGTRLQSVGSAGGVTLFAVEGSQTPYSALYAPNAKGGTLYNKVVPIN